MRFTSKRKRQIQPTVTYTCLVVELTLRNPQTSKELAERRKKNVFASASQIHRVPSLFSTVLIFHDNSVAFRDRRTYIYVTYILYSQYTTHTTCSAGGGAPWTVHQGSTLGSDDQGRWFMEPHGGQLPTSCQWVNLW